METIFQSIKIDLPVHRIYTQWTHFEQFPRFMQGVKKVIALDDQRLSLEPDFSGKYEAWDATITDVTPDERIAWESA